MEYNKLFKSLREKGIIINLVKKDTFKGEWPFKVDNGIIINQNCSIIFVTANKRYAINERARKEHKFLKNITRLRAKSQSGLNIPLRDILNYGLNMK